MPPPGSGDTRWACCWPEKLQGCPRSPSQPGRRSSSSLPSRSSARSLSSSRCRKDTEAGAIVAAPASHLRRSLQAEVDPRRLEPVLAGTRLERAEVEGSGLLEEWIDGAAVHRQAD